MKRQSGLIIALSAVIFSCSSTTNVAKTTEPPCVPNTTESCVCAADYKPVCGCDNKTYPNACHAKCSNVTFVEGECKDKK